MTEPADAENREPLAFFQLAIDDTRDKWAMFRERLAKEKGSATN